MKELEVIKFGKHNITKDKNLIHSIKELLAFCIFSPTDVKLSNIIDYYASKPNLKLLLLKFGKVLVGIVGIKLMREKVIIKHIAISPYYRKQGFGRKVIKMLPLKYKVRIIEAETDAEAVEFYRKTGFSIQEVKVKPNSTPRFLCTLKI